MYYMYLTNHKHSQPPELLQIALIEKRNVFKFGFKIYLRVKFQVEHGFGPRLLGTDVEPLGHRFENQRCFGQFGNEQERVGEEQAEGEHLRYNH